MLPTLVLARIIHSEILARYLNCYLATSLRNYKQLTKRADEKRVCRKQLCGGKTISQSERMQIQVR